MALDHSVVTGIMAAVLIVAVLVAVYEGVVWVVGRILVALAKSNRSGSS